MAAATKTGPTPHVVILGGGFAGIYAARRLAKAPVHLTVIDRRNHHLFQPMLYQVATAALAPEAISYPIRRVLRGQENAEVILGEASSIDVAERLVTLVDGSSITYDYLIVCVGARHSYYGHNEWELYAPGLKTLEDGLEVRKRILLAFEMAERETDVAKRHAHLTFVIVGGGPTGVEMAGAVAEIRRFALTEDFRHIDPREATVMLLEGGKRLLPSYPEELSALAKERLRRLGVEVRTETMVNDVTAHHVAAGGWVIPTRSVIWAAGNQASPLLRSLGVPLDRVGRVPVEPDCTIPGHPEVFVLGDACAFNDPRYGILPGICPVAIQMGEYSARTIAGDLAVKPRTPFRYWNKGQIAVIGRGQAVADIGKLHFGGFFAWLTWAFVHIFFLIGFRNRVIVFIEWAWAYITFQRGSRVFSGGPEPEGLTWPEIAGGIVGPPTDEHVAVRSER